jgi:hypothetical protein
MANAEHVKILKQGVDVWNRWRKDQSRTIPNLSRAELSYMNLSEINLKSSNLTGSDLHHTNLNRANLEGANLSNALLSAADLTDANLSRVNLVGANLTTANLTNCTLSNTFLNSANFSLANLTNANLTAADLTNTNLNATKLLNTDLSQAICASSVFANVDLSSIRGLEIIQHRSPSTIGIDTLQQSGKLPEIFLRGCGIPQTTIDNLRYIVDIPAIEFYSCFVSHSSRDDEFVNHLVNRMRDNRLRVWNDADDIKGGRKIHEQLYEAIHYHDKFIIVLSEASMNSKWVETEIRRARKRERDEQRRVLFPIRLVPYETIQKWELFDADEGRDLAQEIREYYIPDFSNWKDYDVFKSALEHLIDDLRKAE